MKCAKLELFTAVKILHHEDESAYSSQTSLRGVTTQKTSTRNKMCTVKRSCSIHVTATTVTQCKQRFYVFSLETNALTAPL
jgi:hypothetical protein